MEDQDIRRRGKRDEAEVELRGDAAVSSPLTGERDHDADVRIHRAHATTAQIQKGQLDAPSKDEVVAYLRKNRLIVVNVREAPKQIKLSLGGQRVKTRDIVIFTRQFATMINAGLPLVQSLNILAAADREQDAEGRHPGGGVRRRERQHARRRASQASQGVHASST